VPMGQTSRLNFCSACLRRHLFGGKLQNLGHS
jgi:hypothetical protein